MCRYKLHCKPKWKSTWNLNMISVLKFHLLQIHCLSNCLHKQVAHNVNTIVLHDMMIFPLKNLHHSLI